MAAIEKMTSFEKKWIGRLLKEIHMPVQSKVLLRL